MPDIYAHTGDANLRMNNEASWSAARDASTAEVIDTTATSYAAGIRVQNNSGAYTVRRYFLAVDTSGISFKPVSATLKIYGLTNAGSNIIAVKVNQAATGDASTNFAAADFDQIDFTTPFSSEYSATWNTSGYNEIALNDAALTEMLNFDSIKIAVIGHDHDFLDVEPSVGFSRTTGFYPATATSAANRPFISYSLEHASSSDEVSEDYTISTFGPNNLDKQFIKIPDQVPFSLGTKGPRHLRGRSTSYSVSLGTKSKK